MKFERIPNNQCEWYHYMSKIVLVGESGVGKSSTLFRMISGEYHYNNPATIGIEFGTFHIETERPVLGRSNPDPVRIKVQMWDCAGQMRFRNIIRSYFRQADIVCFMYDVSEPSTFHILEDWLENVAENIGPHRAYLKCIIGNKVDLRDTKSADGNDFMISTQKGREFAEKHGALFAEISAKSNLGIERIFMTLLKKAYEKFIEDGTPLLHSPPDGLRLNQKSQNSGKCGGSCNLT